MFKETDFIRLFHLLPIAHFTCTFSCIFFCVHIILHN